METRVTTREGLAAGVAEIRAERRRDFLGWGLTMRHVRNRNAALRKISVHRHIVGLFVLDGVGMENRRMACQA